MSMNWKDRWSIGATMVADAFIDEYMAGANGEYVKVYLYILRHQGEELTVESIADALDHTESDVRRAVSYWEKLGILSGAENEKKQEGELSWAADPAASCAEAKEETAASADRAPVYSAAQVNRLCGDEEFSQLLYIAQKYLNKVFLGKILLPNLILNH